MIDVPEECRSKAPAHLRNLAHKHGLTVSPAERQMLLNAAAEIEGSEEAYVVLVSEIRGLREKLANTERNLRATLELVPRRDHLNRKSPS